MCMDLALFIHISYNGAFSFFLLQLFTLFICTVLLDNVQIMRCITHNINLTTSISSFRDLTAIWTQFWVPNNASWCNQITNAWLQTPTSKVKGGVQHKPALFTLGVSSGGPQTWVEYPSPPGSICHPVRQPAPTCCRKSQSTFSPLGPQTTQCDTAPISLIKIHIQALLSSPTGCWRLRKNTSLLTANTACLKETKPICRTTSFIKLTSAMTLDTELCCQTRPVLAGEVCFLRQSIRKGHILTSRHPADYYKWLKGLLKMFIVLFLQ